MKKNLATVLAFGILAGAASVFAQSGNYMPTNIASTPSALQAHQVQGEYFGILSNGDTLGAWVVARGNNSYFLSLLPGGLVPIPGQPGMGKWNGITKYTGTATWNSTTNAYVVTTAAGYSTASINGSGYERTLVGTTNTNVPFVLTRVTRKSPTLGLKPKDSWANHPNLDNALSWYDSATAATNSASELAKWANNGSNPTRSYGGYLYRGVRTAATHGAGILHIEAMSAFYPTATGQSRGNSGVYLHSKYEAQVLDSFGLNGASDELGGIYKVRTPLTNAALPAMTFQTYDIYFTPRTSGANGDTTGAAVMSVYLNGVLVQDSVPVPVTTEAGATGSQLSASYLAIQNHNNEVVFNNVWFVPVTSGTPISHNALRQALPYDSLLVHAGVTSIARDSFGRAGGLRPLLQSADRYFDLSGRRVGPAIAPQVIVPAP